MAVIVVIGGTSAAGCSDTDQTDPEDPAVTTAGNSQQSTPSSPASAAATEITTGETSGVTTVGTDIRPAPTITPAPAPEPAALECADREGATVTLLADIEVPAVEVPAVTTPAVEIAGDIVDGTTIEGFTIPGQIVDAGCVIEYAAPGGCLGAVEISAATIGPTTIPATVIADLALPDGQVVNGSTLEAVTAPMVVAPAVRTEAVCQVTEGGEAPTVSRAGIVRRAVSRDGIVRAGGARAERCIADECVPAVRVDAVRLEPVRLPDIDIEPARLQRRKLRNDVDVMEGDGTTAYITSGDVLFASDQAVIRPDADTALSEVAAQIATAPAAGIRIEGHTDDRADEAHNLDLSVRRAQAVADWFVERAGIEPSRITVVGLGESTPAYPNDSDEHRQLNRRVVITVDE